MKPIDKQTEKFIDAINEAVERGELPQPDMIFRIEIERIVVVSKTCPVCGSRIAVGKPCANCSTVFHRN